MRIAFISEHASPLAPLGGTDAGGQNVYVAELSRHLGQLGFPVDVFTRRDDPALPERVPLAPGVTVVHIAAGPPEPIPKDHLFPLMPAMVEGIDRAAAATGGYALLHSHFWMSGWVGCVLRRRWRVPLVHTFHALGVTKRRHQGAADTSPLERIPTERQIVRQADCIIATAPHEVEELARDYWADRAKIAVVPCGVDTTHFRPQPAGAARQRLGLPLDRLILLYVGRVLPRKGIDTILLALDRLPRDLRSRVLGLVVGGAADATDPLADPEVARLHALARALGLSDQVRFTGWRPRAVLPDYFAAADVVVTTPWYEPFGMVPLEAMACGRPVVAAAVGGLAFSVVHEETGLLVPPRDPAALAVALTRLFRQPDLGRRLGAAGRARVVQHFGWPVIARRVAAVYAGLLAGTPAVLPQGAMVSREDR